MSSAVADFERAFAEYVGARYCIALCNGTATLHTALVALGVKPGDRVAVPPLTMSATTIAVLHAGAVPVFVDVDPDTWLMRDSVREATTDWRMGVSLYGLNQQWAHDWSVDDAAQTLRQHAPHVAVFTSYSFQSSKILALGEGGALVTDSEELAERARSFSSLGYRMAADQPRISKAVLKDPAYERHHTYPAWNYRMSELVAAEGLRQMPVFDCLRNRRQGCAHLYRDAVAGCSWIKPQHVPDGWAHDYWSYAVALESADLWHPFADAVERHGGARPFAAWRLTYHEPAFRHLVAWPDDPGGVRGEYYGLCPVAEDLQPRIVAGQTNDLESAKRNAAAWECAIHELNGCPA